jgi:hypothetical protein
MIGLITLNPLKLNLPKLPLRVPAVGKTQARASLLGLALDGHRLEAVLVRRVNGSVRVQNSTAASLQLNLLTDDPELVGREIRNHLDRAGIHERQCTVCIPLEWALTMHTTVPQLPAEDVDSFLGLEAEKGFPFGQDSLSTAISRCRAPSGAEFATLIAIPKDHLLTLQKVMKAAHLKPVSFSLGMPVLQDPFSSGSEGMAALHVGENSVQLQVSCGGGIAALRTLQGALEPDGVRKKPYVDVVARDLRITLGQLPAELRANLQRLKVFGHAEDLGRFVDELGARAKLLGLQVEWVKQYQKSDFGVEIPSDAAVTPALSLGVQLLTKRQSGLEFLPPKVSAWKQLTHRYSSGKLVWTAAAAGALVLLVGAAFLLQQWQLSRWRSQWVTLKPRVTELDQIQQEIRRYRPWFDDSFRCLSVLQRITEAFPEDGSVVAKTVEVRDPGVVTCTGTTGDPKALLRVTDQLRATKEITHLTVDQIRGKQFSINLRWSEGGRP